jgi:hypothetical protein
MKPKAEGKVVSLDARREAKAIEETMTMGVLYQSLIAGIPEDKVKKDIRYFGVIYTIPAEEFEDEGIYESFEGMESFTVIKDGKVGEFTSLEGQGIERYEIYDAHTDDIHVMYRIPYSPSKNKPVKDTPKP